MISSIDFSQQLIRIPSYSGNNPEVIELLKNTLQKIGFECKIIDFDGDGSYKVNNLHAIYNPKKSSQTIYFAGHTDVVNEGDRSLWQYDPFEANQFIKY